MVNASGTADKLSAGSSRYSAWKPAGNGVDDYLSVCGAQFNVKGTADTVKLHVAG